MATYARNPIIDWEVKKGHYILYSLLKYVGRYNTVIFVFLLFWKVLQRMVDTFTLLVR